MHIRWLSDEASSNVVNVVLDSPGNIRGILGAERRQIDGHAGQEHSLLVTQ